MFRVTGSTLAHWIKNRSIPQPIRIGRKRLWVKTEIESFIAGARQGGAS
jgi:predicted DNA-binding transcriptional regulator AlpA